MHRCGRCGSGLELARCAKRWQAGKLSAGAPFALPAAAEEIEEESEEEEEEQQDKPRATRRRARRD